MKCLNKITKQTIAALLCSAIVFTMTGCSKSVPITNAYHINSDLFGLVDHSLEENETGHLMGTALCIANEDITSADVDMTQAEGAGLFDISNHETVYAKNVHEKLYPASTTKILTAYLVLKHGNLNDIVTISKENVMLENDSSNCGLKAGDQISVKDLLYGLMLRSANEAANALADYISGSTEAFADLMNQEAYALGATNSHFMTANGLHHEDHYTTVYDLYLIFEKALENDTFREICGSTSYTANYQDKNGKAISVEWKNTMQYFTRNQIPPEGVTILAGKTGTTSKALSCLTILAENEQGEEYISIILKSKDRGVLYEEMNDLLEEINK